MTTPSAAARPLRLIAYLRVSTDRQAEHGLGLTVQRSAITAWAKSAGHKIIAWHTDSGVSGSNGLADRPGLADAFGELESKRADGLVVYRLDRLARKLALQMTWIEQVESDGRAVISVTEPDVGEDEMRTLVRQIMGAISEYERATIRRRMTSGRAVKRERGDWAGDGPPPFGYRPGKGDDKGRLVQDESESAGVALIMALSGDGKSLRQIAAELDGRGILSKRGTSWHPQMVARVIAREGATS